MGINIDNHIKEIISAIGENPEREGLQKTPERVSKAYEYLFSGYDKDIETVINNAIFTEESRGMVMVKDIELYSMCEHHMLPFFGKCHVAYIPSGKVIGVSKIPRIVDVFSRRMQIQERLTDQIADTLIKYLNPMGVSVVIQAKHLCMMMRGVEKQNSVMTTSAVRGVFAKNHATRDEFLKLLNLQ